MHHLPASDLYAVFPQGLNRTHPHPAVESPGRALSSGREEIHGPAIEVHTIDKILLPLGWFAEMVRRRIVGIGNRSIPILVIDGILAPDISLANVNSLLPGKVFLVLCRKETGHYAQRTIAIAHHFGHFGQSVVQIPIDLFYRIVGIGKIGPGKKSDLIPVGLMIAHNQLPDLTIIDSSVLQRQPTECPGDPAPRKSLDDGLPEFNHPGGGM